MTPSSAGHRLNRSAALARMRKAAQVIAQVHHDARRRRATAKAHGPHLRPGLYLRSGRRVWRHVRQPVPPHVDVSKGRTSARTRVQRYAPTRRRGARMRLARLPEALVLPWFWNPRSVGAQQGYPLLCPTGQQSCVLLDPVNARVGRPDGAARISAADEKLHRRWSRHVPAPGLLIDRTSGWLLESFVEGHHLGSLSIKTQLGALGALLRSYAELVTHEGRGDSRHLVDTLLAPEVLDQLPETLTTRLKPSTIRVRAKGWPLVPSVGDPQARNLVVSHDGQPHLIDVFPMTEQPFFVDPLLIVARRSRLSPTLQALLDGALDDELSQLFAAAGCRAPSTRPAREEMIALALLLSDAARQLEDDKLSPETLAARVTDRLVASELVTEDGWRPRGQSRRY